MSLDYLSAKETAKSGQSQSPIIKRFTARYFDESLDLSVQVFHLLGFIGVILGLVSAFNEILTDLRAPHIILNLSVSIFAILLIRFAKRTGRYRICSIITIITVFLVVFPVLYFTGQGYLSSLPMFFLLAFLFTALMLDGWQRAVFLLVEFVVYVSCFIIEQRVFGQLAAYSSSFQNMMEVLMGFACVAIALIIILTIYIRMYNKQRRKLDEQNVILAEVSHAKTEFLQNISHELKTPLTAIINYALDTLNELEKEPLNAPEMAFNQTRIRAEGERLKRMVSQLLDVTAIESGKLNIHKEPVSLAALLSRAADAHFNALNENEIRLTIEVPDGLPDIPADTDAIEQVLLNLLSNAVRHTKEGAIVISLSAGDGFQTVCVSDDGEGIAPEVREQVFSRYVERESKITGRSGMGLFICKKLIDAHGGEIGIESEPGKGAAVWFRLPTGKTEGERIWQK